MHILVTGGAGYIGSTTTAHFLAAGHEVTVYDSLVKGHREAIPTEAHFIKGDIGDASALDILLQTQQFDAAVHFAAFIEAGESMELPGKYFYNNVSKSQVLLDALQRHGVDKLVFSSTAAVYASQNARLSEESQIGPTNVYGQTKLMIEQMIDWYHQQVNLKYAILRYFNACGAMVDDKGNALRGEAHTPETHLIPLTLQVPNNQRDHIKIFGDDYATQDGSCVRDYIHVEDLALAHVLAVEALFANERTAMTYNIGNGQGYSVKDVIDVARTVTNHPIPAETTARRDGDSAMLVASSEKINDELGWMPRYPDLKDIIGTAWAWHQSHPNGYTDGAE